MQVAELLAEVRGGRQGPPSALLTSLQADFDALKAAVAAMPEAEVRGVRCCMCDCLRDMIMIVRGTLNEPRDLQGTASFASWY